MKRSEAMQKISVLLDKKCADCEIKKQREKEYGSKGRYATADSYCLHECKVGAQLKELGSQLGKGATQCVALPRKQRREMMLEESMA